MLSSSRPYAQGGGSGPGRRFHEPSNVLYDATMWLGERLPKLNVRCVVCGTQVPNEHVRTGV